MRKFIYLFIFYIGMFSFLFNPCIVCAETLPMFGEGVNIDKNKPLIEAENEFFKFYIMLNLADKLFEGEKINGDLSGYLRRVWPKAKEEKLKYVEDFTRFFVSIKRRYVYVTKRLEQRIKAASLLPKEAKVVAKDGEFAPKYTDERKKTADGTYEVSYTPYKYLEYASGDIGNPVHRRDKNFEEVSQDILDELTLALLEFNLGKFYRALKTLPAYNDGTREKAVQTDDGVKARLLLDTAYPGDKPTIRGVIEVLAPKGYYINGDYLNESARPVFFLSEDSKENLNIKDYKLYAPVPSGVVIGKKAVRVLTENVLFPIEFTRIDYEKPMKVRGDFSFLLCKAEDASCKRVLTHHFLVLNPSPDEQVSIHYNFVTKGFSALPREKSKNARLKSAVINQANNTLEVTFDTSSSFSNTAVMAEDALGTSFLNPRYQIKENEISAVFDYDNEAFFNAQENNEIAITASFDDDEILRTVAVPHLFDATASESPMSKQRTFWDIFGLGILLSLMPGVLCLLTKFSLCLSESSCPKRVFVRYTATLGGALVIYLYYCRLYSFEGFYDNGFVNALALIICAGLLMESLGYMNFIWFRPLKTIFPLGVSSAILIMLLIIAYPFLWLPDVLEEMRGASLFYCLKVFLGLWGGLSVLTVISTFFNRKARIFAMRLKAINILFNLLYLLFILGLIWCLRGFVAVAWGFGGIVFCLLLWYGYPLALEEAITRVRLKKQKIALFEMIQKHAAYALTILFFVFGLILEAFSLKPISLPLFSSVREEISCTLDEGKPVIVSIYDIKSLNNLFSKSLKQNMENFGIEVLSYDTRIFEPRTSYWLKAYRQKSLPLHILFTNRHKEGLILPQDLGHINWQNALKEFVILPQKPIYEQKERNNQP